MSHTFMAVSENSSCKIIMKFLLVRLFSLGTFSALVWMEPGMAQILNPGFENWTDCLPDDWATPNACGVLVPVTRSTSAHSGSFAARGEVVSLGPVTIQPVLQNGADAAGVAISQRYQSVKGFYRFSPIGGDRFAVNVAFFKNGNVVAQGATAVATAVPADTAFEVPLTYQSPDVPDNATIQIQIIGPNGIDVHPGSVMFVDDVSFSGSGISAAPTLSLRRDGNTITVSWPANVSGYVLQSSPTLAPPVWSNVVGVGPGNSYQFTPTGAPLYFRLFKSE